MFFIGKKGQSALEYVLLLGVLLMILIPFFYFGFINSQESSRIIQAQRSVDSLKEAADYVYTQGVGSRTTVELTIPNGVDFNNSYIGKPVSAGPSIDSQEINLRLGTQGDVSDVFAVTKGEIRGSWQSHSGPGLYIVEMTGDGYVMINPYYYEFTVSPAYFTFTIQRGSGAGFNFTVTSVSDYPLFITFNGSGDTVSWISLSAYNATLAAGASQLITGTISVPSDALYGLNQGKITAYSENTSLDVLFDVIVYQEGGGNFTVPNYTVEIFNDSAYSKPWAVFYQGDPVDIILENWPAYSSATVDVKDASNISVSGYPRVVYADDTGRFIDYWYATNVAYGFYTIYANNSAQVQSTAVEISACVG